MRVRRGAGTNYPANSSEQQQTMGHCTGRQDQIGPKTELEKVNPVEWLIIHLPRNSMVWFRMKTK